MTKSPQDALSGYPEQRLEGLRRHATELRQATLERLRRAIEALKARGEPITVQTIRAESHLDYQSYARNPEVLKLFQQHSTFLAAKRKEGRRKRRKGAAEESFPPKDPLLNYKRPQLVARLRQERQRREEIEGQYRQLLDERMQVDLKVMQLEAELARYQQFLGHMRTQAQQEEHDGKTWRTGSL
jgi:hypothetical protein